MKLSTPAKRALGDALGHARQRSTRQREHVFAVLLDKRDHPTADEVYARARATMPAISLATVYNCLETLVGCGLVRQVNIEREPSRYCPNLHEHAHFHDQATGRVYDIDLPHNLVNKLKGVLPAGYEAEHLEISFRGKAALKMSKSA
ncbi:MAG TPA: transcriptional repressor [Opitutales bacterium]|nr:transcriptional repressor [Opitutales bacterium]